jgi:hypothetical protein
LSDVHGDDVAIFFVECELRVEVVGIGDLVPDAAGELLPNLLETVHVRMVAEEDWIGGGVSEG